MGKAFRIFLVGAVSATLAACGGSPEPSPELTAVTATPVITAESGGGSTVRPDLQGNAQVVPSNPRFVLVMPVDGEYQAVRDEQTGLIWERVAVYSGLPGRQREGITWYNAMSTCLVRTTGGRYGWRLPTVPELASLVDPGQSEPALPRGHPFVTDTDARWSTAAFWTATERFEERSGLNRATILMGDDPTDAPLTHAWAVRFSGSGNNVTPLLKIDRTPRVRTLTQINTDTLIMSAWCVRGW